MTPDDLKPLANEYIPSPAEIEAACIEIRKTWSEDRLSKRRKCTYQRQTVREIRRVTSTCVEPYAGDRE